MNFATLRFFSIVPRSITETSGCEILSVSANAVLDVFAFHSEGPAFLIDAAQCDVNVRIFCIVVLRRDPL